jgi:pimeloyl-ACP methyl ester carboxylesterase
LIHLKIKKRTTKMLSKILNKFVYKNAALLVGFVMIGGASIACAQESVTPSTVDPAVHASDEPNLIYGDGPNRRNAPLVVFLPGTNGTSDKAPDDFLRTIASLGYRVIFLSYDDDTAGSKICPRAPSGCYTQFRASRLFGDPEGSVATPTAEAIVPRLNALLRYLDHEHPGQGWNQYLTQQGVNWSNIVVSGLSQGAGMAAFLAKRYPVRRVVLFSSPWDFMMPGKRPAPWLFNASATPPDRWWAERHEREKTTVLIAQAYVALQIPENHILIFDGPLPPNAKGSNPYHGSTIRLLQYVPEWKIMFGNAQ